MPRLGLKTLCGIALSHSGRPSTAGNGRGTMVSRPGKQRNFNFIPVAWSMAHFQETARTSPAIYVMTDLRLLCVLNFGIDHLSVDLNIRGLDYNGIGGSSVC